MILALFLLKDSSKQNPVPPPPCPDGDPKERGEQELGGLHGALQGEQVPEREERLRHHPLLPGDELPLLGEDDHPQGQAEHGQRVDAALATSQEPPDPSRSYCCTKEDDKHTHSHKHTLPHTPWASASSGLLLSKRQKRTSRTREAGLGCGEGRSSGRLLGRSSFISHRLETGAETGDRCGSQRRLSSFSSPGPKGTDDPAGSAPSSSSQIWRLLAAHPILNPSFLYISSVFVHVVALLSERMSPRAKHSR